MNHQFGSKASYKVIQRLEEAGYEAVFVGGAVRDFILGKEAKDFDIATSAEPDEVKLVFTNTVDVGIAHGTVLVMMDGESIEVTTYRTESTYTDHRRPDDVQFVKSLKEDLLRRDFTMNALAMTAEGQIIDLFNGKEDMAHNLVRAVGNAEKRFSEDALRMLRAVRFSSVLGFDIETTTFQAICDHADQIGFVSIERLKIEMDKLFMGDYVVQALEHLTTSNLSNAFPVFPANLVGLNHVVPFEKPVEGWAYLSVIGDYLPSAFSKAYKLSNEEEKFIKAVKSLYKNREIAMYTVEEYYINSFDVLRVVEKFYCAINPKSPRISDKTIEDAKRGLPIQSIKDLSVDGKNLMEWTGLAGGKWTGFWISKIEYSVLHGLVENEPNKIKDWFTYEFEREK